MWRGRVPETRLEKGQSKGWQSVGPCGVFTFTVSKLETREVIVMVGALDKKNKTTTERQESEKIQRAGTF